jgi:hypothetical protein
MNTEARPAAEETFTAISAAAAMHAGHISPPFYDEADLLHSRGGFGTVRLGMFPRALQNPGPAGLDSFPVLFFHETEGGVAQRDQRSAILFGEPVLDVGHERQGRK